MGSATMPILWSNGEYEIRPAVNNDEFRDVWLGYMHDLSWERCYYDLDTYMSYSNGYGMIILIHKASGKIVGHVCAVINDNSTGWVAMFIITAAHRGRGLGAELFKACMADFERKGTKVVGLDGVAEQKGTYERRKFVSSPLGNLALMMRPLVAKVPMADHIDRVHGELVDLRKVPGELLAQHELKHTGFYRPKLWTDKIMFNRPDAKGVALVSKTVPQTAEDIEAWALTRRSPSGIRIGPVYAKDALSARAVLVAAMGSATPETIKKTQLPNDPIGRWSDQRIADEASFIAEVWGGNAEAVKLFESLGWKDSGLLFYRMWVDGKATPEQQSAEGAAQRGVFAIFDAAVG